MVVSWIVRLPEVGVRVTVGVEGRPEGKEKEDGDGRAYIIMHNTQL